MFRQTLSADFEIIVFVPQIIKKLGLNLGNNLCTNAKNNKIDKIKSPKIDYRTQQETKNPAFYAVKHGVFLNTPDRI